MRKLSLWTTITEPSDSRLLCSATREATAMRSLGTAMRSSLCSLQLEKFFQSNEDPAQAKKKKKNRDPYSGTDS